MTIVRLPLTIWPLLWVSSACNTSVPAEDGIAAVIEFLMDSEGMGQFERPDVYCVASDDTGAELEGSLAGQAWDASDARVVAGPNCRYSVATGRMVMGPDSVTAVVIWARLPTTSESERFRTTAPTVSPEAQLLMVRAGYDESPSSRATYVCWVAFSNSETRVHSCEIDSVT